MIFSRNSSARSWVPGALDTPFPIQNLPYAVFRRADGAAHVGVAIHDAILDLAVLYDAGFFEASGLEGGNVFDRRQLNDFMAMGQPVWRTVRRKLVALLADTPSTEDPLVDAAGDEISLDPRLRENEALRQRAFIPCDGVELLMPSWIGAFVDFYASKEHATNVGSMFRDPANALPPNWLYLPIGYHGRPSSVVVSGTSIRRPYGQSKMPDDALPHFGPSQRLDFELEMGFFTGPGNDTGAGLSMTDAPRHIFGMVLVNDWSARDIQKWEYTPLGPFLGKSFATSVSPWVVPLDALEPFRIPQPTQTPIPLPYLCSQEDWGLDVELDILLQTASMQAPVLVASTNFRHMYWTIAQQLAHVTSNGTNIEPGDLYASGTVSGASPDAYGSLLELAWQGTKQLRLPDGQQRAFLEDGDTVILRGCCRAEHYTVGFGEVSGRILPALPVQES